MKKAFVLILSVFMIFLAVSCATTKGADIPDAVRVVEPIQIGEHPMDEASLWKALTLVMNDFELSEEIKADEASKTIFMNDIVLGSNVGALAQDGEVVVKGALHVEGDKVRVVVSFVDAYTFIQLGPISKKVSTGLTSLGMHEYELQTGWLLDAYESWINQSISVYGVSEGWYGVEAQNAYKEEMAKQK